jgi:hypothetical protein
MSWDDLKAAYKRLASSHWGWLLVLALPLLVFFALSAVIRLLRPAPVVVDPVEKADARAEKEAEVREAGAAAIEAKLDADLNDLKAKQEKEAAEAYMQLEKKFNELRKNPKKLAEAMKKVGRGEKL